MNPEFCGHQILDVLGQGGMGTVYRAQRNDGKVVALKMMAQHLLKDESARQRFIHEPKLYPVHPNIVRVFDTDECDGTPFFTMEIIEGESFDKVLNRVRVLAPEQFWSILREVASALDVVHSHGIVHRDLKPSNILIRAKDDRAFLTDFGVAKNTQGTKLTQVSGVRIGTAHYMSPEQAMGKRDLTSAADIYALGVMAYRALSGQVPFDAEHDLAIARMHLQEAPRSLHKANPHISTQLDDVVMRALNKDPKKRYSSASAFVSAFEKAMHGSTEKKSPNPFRMVASAAGIVVLLAVSFLVVELLSDSSASKPAAVPATMATTVAAPTNVESGAMFKMTSTLGLPTTVVPTLAPTATDLPPTPTMTVTPAKTSTPKPPTATASATIGPSRTPQSTALPKVAYPPPQLISPKSGELWLGNQAFSWASSVTLTKNDYYVLEIEHAQGIDCSVWTKNTSANARDYIPDLHPRAWKISIRRSTSDNPLNNCSGTALANSNRIALNAAQPTTVPPKVDSSSGGGGNPPPEPPKPEPCAPSPGRQCP